MRIEGLVVIVTGGASGLGEATVRLLRQKGAKVVIADLNEKAGQALADELGGKDTIFFKTDVTSEENIKELVQKAVSSFGRLSAVVNCAGVIHAGMFVSSKGVIPTKQLELAFKINVFGTFNVCKYAAQQMSQQEAVGGERGVLINVASVAGFEGQRGQTVYGATKGAIISMTLPMARDLGKFGIRVMTIAPGVFETPMAAGMNDKTLEGLRKMTALGRNGSPPEFAACVSAILENPFANG